MCACKEPNINGNPGYSWDGKTVSVHPVDPPDIAEGDWLLGDSLLFDEPGRCGGGIDGHSIHFRVVMRRDSLMLLAKTGNRVRRFGLGPVGRQSLIDYGILKSLGTNARFWLLYTIYQAYVNGLDLGADRERTYWETAAAEKRIKTRKMRNSKQVKVWVLPAKKSEVGV